MELKGHYFGTIWILYTLNIFAYMIFSRIWPKFLQILSSREFNFAILVVLSLVQIDMKSQSQNENFRDHIWFAKFAKIKPPRNIPRIIVSSQTLDTLTCTCVISLLDEPFSLNVGGIVNSKLCTFDIS